VRDFYAAVKSTSQSAKTCFRTETTAGRDSAFDRGSHFRSVQSQAETAIGRKCRSDHSLICHQIDSGICSGQALET